MSNKKRRGLSANLELISLSYACLIWALGCNVPQFISSFRSYIHHLLFLNRRL